MLRVLAGLIACLLPAVAFAQDVGAPRLHVLDNGLRVLVVEDRTSPLVTVTWSAHVGDSSEPLDFAGNSHYLEHLLLFRGTDKYPGNQIGEWTAGRGGYLNGTPGTTTRRSRSCARRPIWRRRWTATSR